MTKIEVQPIVLKDCELIIDVDDYAAHVSKVQFDPNTPSASWKGLAPSAVFNASGASTWTCSLEYAQDWTTPDSLSRYLLAHAGEKKDVTFQPEAGAGLPAFLATVTIAPGPIGGTVDGVPTGAVTLQVDGAPVPDWDNDPLTPNP